MPWYGVYRITSAWFETFAAAEQSSGNFLLSSGCFYPSDANLQWSSGCFYPSDGSFLSSSSNFRQSNGRFQRSSAYIVFEKRSAFGSLLK